MATEECTVEKSYKLNPKLYYSPFSFYSQKVLLALYEKKVKFQPHSIDLDGQQYEPWFMKINPKGQVPVLCADKCVPDSSNIIQYLEEKFSEDGTPRLLPAKDTEASKKEKKYRELLDSFPSPLITFGCVKFPELTVNMKMGSTERKIRSKAFPVMLERLDKNIATYPEFKPNYEEKKDAFKLMITKVEDKDNVIKAIDDVKKVLDVMEEELSTHKEDKENWWLCCEEFTWADIMLSLILHRLWYVGLWESYFGEGKNPCLAEYFKRVQKRDSFKRTFVKCPVLLHLMHSNATTKGLIAATGVALVVGVAATGAILYHKLKKA